MKLPLSWLKDYVEWNVTPDEFVEKLMWRGFEVASYSGEMDGITNVVVGKILSLSKHENSDHLQICSIDVGKDEPVCIVTGAQNVFEGALVPVALDGAHLTEGIVIKPTVMRGVKSNGMLCSGRELGLTEADYPGAEVNGIMILHEEHELGQSIQEAIGLDDIVFDIELTPNRADCQSIIGMCREAAAALGQKFREPVIRKIKGEGNVNDYASVTVLNTELCPRYTARVVTELNIEPSPVWMQKRLRAVGMRPINNIVDITNYVLVEYGHPMHAFDLACVKDGNIVVRNAYENEVVTTLDGKERPVTPDMLLIADTEKGVGIAGVMGGLNSEITKDTKATLFESAAFKGSSIRATTRKLHHVTDAAARFIKGVEPVNAMLAEERAIELVDELNAGKVIGGVIDVCNADITEHKVDVDVAHINSILNTNIPAKDMADMLATINISSKVKGAKLEVTIPHYRTDIEDGLEADWDIAEEVARIYGYYNIKPTLMYGDTFAGKLGKDLAFEDKVKDEMAAQGCYEMYNYNFTGPAALDNLLLEADSEKRQCVKILNPFGEDQSLMRTTLIMGMLDSLKRNQSRKTGHDRFFEVGNVHFDNNDDLPEERKLLGLLFSGDGESYFTLKGAVEQLLEQFDLIPKASFAAGGSEYYQPGRKAVLSIAKEKVGELGAVHPNVLKNWGIDGRAYYAEIDMNKLFKYVGAKRTYKPISKFPKVARDIAIVVDDKITAAEVSRVIAQTRLKVVLDDIELFAVYRGTGIPEGKKSMAYSFTLRSEDHTLVDEEIQAAMGAVIRALETRLKAELRG